MDTQIPREQALLRSYTPRLWADDTFKTAQGIVLAAQYASKDTKAYKLVEIQDGKYMSTGCGSQIGKILEYKAGESITSSMQTTQGLYVFSIAKEIREIMEVYAPPDKEIVALLVIIPKDVRYVKWKAPNGMTLVQAETIRIVGEWGRGAKHERIN